jgi:hypothetical protein
MNVNMKQSIGILSMLLSLLFVSCKKFKEIDFKDYPHSSKNIQESKKINVFVREFQIQNVKSFTNIYQFPFVQVWEERGWHTRLEESGKEIPEIYPYNCRTLIFSLIEKDSFYTDNCGEKWIVKLDSSQWGSLPGSINDGMLFINLHSDCPDVAEIPLTIYKQSKIGDFKRNLVSLFKFDLVNIDSLVVK